MNYSNFIRFDERKIIFYVHQRCNCTILKQNIFEEIGCLQQALQYNQWIHYYYYDIFYPSHKVTLQMLTSKEYKLIQFVRNPYCRVVSIFLGLYKTILESGEYNKGEYLKSVDENIQIMINENKYSFYNFLLYIKKNMSQITDYHILPQTYNNLDLIFDDIVKIEDYNMFEKLNSKYKLTLKNNIRTSSHHINNDNINIIKNNNTITAYTIFNQYELLKRLPEYNKFYENKEIKNLIYEIYKDDIEKFNY